ncbi:conserved hypothetical protein [Candidatus Desulfarcum epimagneticum]|uniref:Sulfotransferase domain-containing protein n=1 Tax=uncultured Desulfobacteraceae bacterium TaxID=218296 RepID=A0A484HIQ8_9BACT|nr:conserved hypothetical protein [uncultured Desulfobacteraceae bacterium]
MTRETLINPPKIRKKLDVFRKITGRWRVLPDFVIIGAQRSGTTTLYENLISHPDVAPAIRKEVQFFSKNFSNKESWYRSHFPLSATRFVKQKALRRQWMTGEASPYYIFHPYTPERFHALNPGARLILILRNPVDRAYSSYWMQRRRGSETLPFREAIKAEPERMRKGIGKLKARPNELSFEHSWFSYIGRGVYADQLAVWLKYFPRHQILIIRSEDLFEKPDDVFSGIFSFLGLPAYRLPVIKEHHRKKYPAMSEETRRALSEYFRPHNKRLYEMLGRDFGWGLSCAKTPGGINAETV